MTHQQLKVENLRYDPLNIFQESRTPVSLYSRKKWIGLENTTEWKKDYRKTVSELYDGQLVNGSWSNSLVLTIKRLFGLHLTVRNLDKRIENALIWLLTRNYFTTFGQSFRNQKRKIAPKEIQGLPFTYGCFEHFAKGAILFLATIFGKADDERVVSTYEKLLILGEKRKGKWCNWSCSNNIFRAFVVHPSYALSRVTMMAVERLSEMQDYNGTWTRQIPLYHTVNALAHINFRKADVQLKRAFQRLIEIQNKDGTWGKTQKEWKTFLTFHAMKRKSHLLSNKKI